MKSAGGTGTVTSERGLDTTVTLAWTGAETATIPEPVAGPTGTTDLEVFDLLRMDLVYSRGFALAVAIVFAIMTISTNRPFAPGAVISYALMLAIVAVVFPGREHPLRGGERSPHSSSSSPWHRPECGRTSLTPPSGATIGISMLSPCWGRWWRLRDGHGLPSPASAPVLWS
ncbi:hypothetical protein [Corynebacterium sputi]|uniref:hypothetical protein n=1 Tax=Corynebacterium sputi TaxID=489915 RepID=UPI0003FE65FF|nr:hypothetical protein [Corynebacterium sputi]